MSRYVAARIVICGVAGLLAACSPEAEDIGDQASSLREHEAHPITHVTWAQVFQSPDELYRSVDAVVMARAVSVTPGRIAISDSGEHSLPFELVTFRIIRSFKGPARGEDIVVERLGGIDDRGTHITLEADGGPFELDRPVLLFLVRQDGASTYYQVNYQGRFTVAGNRLYGMDPVDPVIAALHGRLVDEALPAIDPPVRPRR